MTRTHHSRPNWHPSYRADIDGLRAVAILSVLCFHAAPQALGGGFVGVDVFFVISGFLITSILSKSLAQGEFSFADFYARRTIRIFPPLLIVLLACLVLGWFNLLDTEYKELGKEVAAGAGFVANISLWQSSGYFDAASRSKPLLHLWSLGVEEQFYLVWPIVLWAGWRRHVRATTVAALVGVGSLLLSVLIAGDHRIADFYLPFTRFWELMLGGLLALRPALAAKPGSVDAHVRALSGLGLIAASALAYSADQPYPGWRALAPTLGAALVISAGTQAWANRTLLSNKLLVGIGLISFPLYLWHWPVLVFYAALTGEWPSGIGLLAAVGLSVALAVLSYRWVEGPCRRSPRRVALGLSLLALMAVVGFAGFNVFHRDGLKFRLHSMVSRFAVTQDDAIQSWRPHTCFLSGEASFSSQCVDGGSAPLFFLWGDSHAAQLYPGLLAFKSRDGYRLAQYTATGCEPLLGTDASYPGCAAYNALALRQIAATRPALVILSANWSGASLAKLPGTISALRAAGVEHIALVGPTPFWPKQLPKTYFLYWRSHHTELPWRTQFGMDLAANAALDRLAGATAARLGVRYASAFGVFCAADGCMTRTAEASGTITTWDESHITPDAAVYLAQRIVPDLIRASGR